MAASSKVPEWASLYDEALFQRFLGEALRSGERRWGKASETLDGVKAGGRVRELRELAELCRYMPERQWARAIDGHFARQADMEAAVEKFQGRPDLRDARERLRIRILPEKTAAGEETPGVSKPVAPGLSASLVLEGNRGAEPVTAEMADGWGMSTAALYEAARVNHKRRKVKKEPGQGFNVGVIMGDDQDAASEILFLEDYIKVEPPAGTIIVVPTQRAVLYHEIHDKKAVDALQTILVIGHQLFQQGPDPVLPLLYWWRRRRFALLPIEVQGETVRFMPPVEFVQALQKVGVDLTG